MGGGPAPAPMGGASDVPPAPDGGMGGGPMGGPDMGGDPGMGGPDMGGDPMGGDPGMGGPDMGGANDGMLNPDMGGPMDGGDEGGDGDSTMSIINQLSPEDREAVRAYAESMLARDENGGGNPEGGPDGGPDMGPDGGPQGGPMMERRINENLPVMDYNKKKDNNVNSRRGDSKLSKKSPFNSPKFK